MMLPTKKSWVLRGVALIGVAGFWGCATSAVVFISPTYSAQHVKRVTVLGFSDAPRQQGSGGMVSDIFEKYLFKLNYAIVDPNQASQALQAKNMTLDDGLSAPGLAILRQSLQVDAVMMGSVSEVTDTSEQTVLVDVPQEVTEPVYQDVVVQGRHGGLHTKTVQTGNQTTIVDQSVQETETLPARVGLSVRLVSAANSELLWSGSGSADGIDIASAADAAASKVTAALQKKLAH